MSNFSCLQKKKESNSIEGTYQYDRNFLQSLDSNLVELRDQNTGASVLVSAKYQGKVFTSSVGDSDETSFGWLNYQALKSNSIQPHMNAYGGESRMWLGPEGGKYSIFFPQGSDFTFKNWQTPAAIDHELWKIEDIGDHSVTVSKEDTLSNFAGYNFPVRMERSVTLLSEKEVLNWISTPLYQCSWVAYSTMNSIENIGSTSWNEDTGGICIWILDMFPPTNKTVVVIPFKNDIKQGSIPIVKDDYFGPVPNNRLMVLDNAILFMADGEYRSKIGITPKRALHYAGSIDLIESTITLVRFDIDEKSKYLNQEWKVTENPYNGDAINAYNDGQLADGSQMGPFYEIESVSPAAYLEPGEKLAHQHDVLHLKVPKDKIDIMILNLFDLNISDLKSFLSNAKKK